jgi:hypothetical protein
MTELTKAKLELACLAIEALRLRGEIGMDEWVSPERIARISEQAGHPVDERTVRRIEQRFFLRARLALQALPQKSSQS